MTNPGDQLPDLSRLFPLEPDDVEILASRLAVQAEAEGLVDVAYRTVDTPLGLLLLAATPRGLVRVAYQQEGFDVVLQDLADRISPRVLQLPRRLDEVATELEQYFSGHRHEFDLDLDHRLSGGFRDTVQRYLRQIQYGTTRTYKEVAQLVGNPRAVRAVGTACATNPLPIIVPCHRVLRTDGSLGGYIGGPEAKKALLRLEHQSR